MGNFQPPNNNNYYDDEEEALYDVIPPPAVKPKPKHTSASSIRSNASDVTITKAERDAIRRVSQVLTDELLQQDEQLARASFHPTVGDTEVVDDDVYEDPNGEIYDDAVSSTEKAAQFRQSLVNNASLTAVVPQPPAPPPIPGYSNEDELYEDTVSASEKAMEYKQHVMPAVTSPPLDTNLIYEEPPAPPPVAPPPPPVAPPFVPDQDYDELPPPKVPAPPPVAPPFVPDQDYDELPPLKAPAPPPVAPPFVPDQDYDELPPPKAVAPPPVPPHFVPDQDYDELPPPKAVAPPFVPDQDYDELPPPKAPAPPPVVPSFVPDQDYDELPPKAPAPSSVVPSAYQDYDDLPPPRPVVMQQPATVEQDDIYDTLGPNTAVQDDIYDVLPPKVTQPLTKAPTTANEDMDMDYDVLPPPKVTNDNYQYATVQKEKQVSKQKPSQDSAIPELDVLGKLVQDVSQENSTVGTSGQGDMDEFSALGSVLSNMASSEDKSSSDEGKWELPSGDDEEEGMFLVLWSKTVTDLTTYSSIGMLMYSCIYCYQ